MSESSSPRASNTALTWAGFLFRTHSTALVEQRDMRVGVAECKPPLFDCLHKLCLPTCPTAVILQAEFLVLGVHSNAGGGHSVNSATMN